MKKVKVKLFEHMRKDTFQESLNEFLETGVDLIDIKLHIDPQVDPSWEGIVATYAALVIYKDK